MLFVHTGQHWKPVIGEPREIRRGKKKGKVEVHIKAINSEGLYLRKCIVDPAKLKNLFN